MVGYAKDSTLMAVLSCPGVKVAAKRPCCVTSAELVYGVTFLTFWGMKLNASNTTTVKVSRSRTMHPQSSPLTIGGTVLKESDDFDILE